MHTVGWRGYESVFRSEDFSQICFSFLRSTPESSQLRRMDRSRRLLNNDLASLAAVRQLELWCDLAAKRGSTFGSRRRCAVRTLTDGVVNQR